MTGRPNIRDSDGRGHSPEFVDVNDARWEGNPEFLVSIGPEVSKDVLGGNIFHHHLTISAASVPGMPNVALPLAAGRLVAPIPSLALALRAAFEALVRSLEKNILSHPFLLIECLHVC